MSIRVLLVDDHTVIREGIRALLEREPDMEVAGEAGDGETAVRLVAELLPDVVVLDVIMPGMNGIDATREILARRPSAKVLALSMHAGSRFVSDMLGAGASGYVLKSSAFEELARAIRAVLAGHTYLSAGTVGVVIQRTGPAERGPPRPSPSVLSATERRVLRLLVSGVPRDQIAADLSLGPSAIEVHEAAIKEKLGIRTLTGLTRYAVREGLISLGGRS